MFFELFNLSAITALPNRLVLYATFCQNRRQEVFNRGSFTFVHGG